MSPTRVSLSMVASRQSPPLFPLAKSLYSVNPERLQPVSGGVAASGEPVPVCDRVQHGSRPGAPAVLLALHRDFERRDGTSSEPVIQNPTLCEPQSIFLASWWTGFGRDWFRSILILVPLPLELA